MQFHNFVTQASYETRIALHHQEEMNRILEQEKDYRSESTNRRINSAAQELVGYLFFKDEYQLTSNLQGQPSFVKAFNDLAIRIRSNLKRAMQISLKNVSWNQPDS